MTFYFKLYRSHATHWPMDPDIRIAVQAASYEEAETQFLSRNFVDKYGELHGGKYSGFYCELRGEWTPLISILGPIPADGKLVPIELGTRQNNKEEK